MNLTATNPFNAIAKEYDQWFDDNKNTFLSELAAVKYFLPKQGKGLEIGVGTGRFAMNLGIKYGIEPSEPMANIAKQRGIDVIIGNAETMPYDNESFDYAIMVAVDPFVENIEKVYREIYRVLKTGGKLIIGTLHKEGEVAQKYMSMSDNEVYKSAQFHTVSETIQQLKTSGFITFNTCQSLFSIQPEKIETPIQGHDKGSFVAIEANKEN
ncbi:MAG: class I SAM-dependent methyltransferase [Salinivirgaceae bacterium]|nr:class I SAM-dependent methyltransferase [Salinivirgaceae bacterium]